MFLSQKRIDEHIKISTSLEKISELNQVRKILIEEEDRYTIYFEIIEWLNEIIRNDYKIPGTHINQNGLEDEKYDDKNTPNDNSKSGDLYEESSSARILRITSILLSVLG